MGVNYHETISRHKPRHNYHRLKTRPYGSKTIEELAEELQDKYLDQQHYFGTDKALKFLTKTEGELYIQSPDYVYELLKKEL